MPHIQITDFFYKGTALTNEVAAYQNGTVTDGYGKAGGAVIQVTSGATVDLNVDFEMTSISEQQFSEWKTRAYDFLSTEQQQHLEEHYSARGSASWMLGALGAISANGNYDHYLNRTDTFNAESGSEREGFMKSLYDLQTSRFRITGNVKVTGTSHIPSEASIFIHVVTIKFSDQKQISVIDLGNPVAASPDGDTSNVKAEPSKLNQVPLS